MGNVFTAPEFTRWSGNTTLFLAGSIDMGKAIDWQTQVINALKDENVDIYNPRRDDWDWTWEQSIDNPKFKEQVSWELKHLELADIICYCFDPNGKGPITLLEFGLFNYKDIVVCCPKGYWRKGNVDIVCERYGIPMVETIEEMISYLKERINDNDQHV